MSRIRSRNPDFIKGINFPLQTYAFSGTQWGSSLDIANGKRPTDTSPMVITSQPPGAFAKNDDSWKLTFGASHDCVFTLFNGKFFCDTSLSQIPINLAGIYRDSIGTGDQNIYEKAQVGDGVQQIQYVVSKETAVEGRDAEDYGDDVDEARSIAMRIPLMAGGWGRTIGMRPTDPEPTEDIKKRRNDEEHKLARETWLYAPIDVRWDERRGVWGAWHDLIADHEGQNLGSLIFSTNGDEDCGFPFLKGKMEDVWRVLKTRPFSNVIGNDKDTTQSAVVTTHLDHEWSQLQGDIHHHAPLTSAFIIHRSDPNQSPVVCGTEKAIESQIEILTGTYFHLSNTIHGPICFDPAGPTDDELVGCMKFDGAEWVPAVPFDACTQVGFELAVLFANDQVLADKIIEVCKLLLECLDKSPGEVDPTKTGAAGAASEKASDASEKAEGALDGLPAGTGPGGEYAEGDTLQTGGEPLTAGEAAALNDSIPAASEAYENAKNKQATAGEDAIEAGNKQSTANDKLNDLAVADQAARDAQSAADAANEKLAEQPNDPSTIEAAEKANTANAEAQGAKAEATSDYNEAANDAKGAKDKADASHKEAKEATADAKTKGDKVRDDAGDKLPDNVREAMDAADKANAEADQAREDSGIGVVPEESAEEQVDEAKKELCDKIDAQACKTAEDLIAVGGAVGQSIQKAINDVTAAVNSGFEEFAAEINSLLGSTIGFDTESLSGGATGPTIAPPAACPPNTGGSQKENAPGVPQEEDDGTGPGGTTPPPPETGGGGSTTKPTGGTTETPPPMGGGGGGDDPKDIPVGKTPPTCPIITILDPCGRPSTHGPCPGGKGSGTPRGTQAPDTGGPGTPGGAPSGGVNPNNGQVFPKPEGKPIGLLGQNKPINLGGGGNG